MFSSLSRNSGATQTGDQLSWESAAFATIASHIRPRFVAPFSTLICWKPRSHDLGSIFASTANTFLTIYKVRFCALWWTRRGSNPRPLRCERSALPAELRAQIGTFYTKKVAEFGFLKYSIFGKKSNKSEWKTGPQTWVGCVSLWMRTQRSPS